MPNIQTVETYKTDDGHEELKKKFTDNPNVFGWIKRGKKVFLITNDETIKSKHKTNSTKFNNLHWAARNNLITYAIQNKFLEIGFLDFKRKGVYLPKSKDEISATTYNSEIQGFINFAFEFTITERRNGLVFVLNPTRVITKNGNDYNSDFSREKSKVLLEKRQGQFLYSTRLQVIEKFKSLFGENFAIKIVPGSIIDFEIHDDIRDEISVISEPEISFGNKKNHTWPKAGLNRFGPLDNNESFSGRPSKINVALIGTKQCFDLLKGLNNGIEGESYSYQGFSEIYSSELVMGDKRFSALTPNEIDSITSPREIVELLLSKAMQIKNSRENYDICLIELVPEWTQYFRSHGVDLHDLIKVEFSKEGIITQIINENSEGNIRTETLENLALGIYFKSGGRPWRIETKFNDIAYVGISFGYLKKENKRLIGIAELFDCYGQFISLRAVGIKEIPTEKYFSRRDHHLSFEQLSNLIELLMEDFRGTLDDNYPKQLIIHKTNRFNKEECTIVNHFKDYPFGLSLIHVQTDHHWHLLKDKEPIRGTFWEISNTSALIYTAGILANQNKYFLPGCPLPLVINNHHSDKFSLKELGEQIIELSKLNFNSTNSYSKEPATLLHSRKIINLLRAGLPEIKIPKDPRFYL